jgi:hypothetical protein
MASYLSGSQGNDRTWSNSSFSFKPTQYRLKELITVTEERFSWLRGHFVREPGIVLEISFESWDNLITIPETPITYFGMWRPGPKSTVFEFQLGKICRIPTPDDYQGYVYPVIDRLKGYRPIQVA